MRKQLNKLLKPLGLSIEKTKKNMQKNTLILENVFETNFTKKVLMSYIKGPFINKMNFEHTNLLECYTAGEIFKNLGYNVDVVNFSESSNETDYSKYSVVYGFGSSFLYALDSINMDSSCKMISYLPGTSCSYSRRVIKEKVHDFYKRTGAKIVNSTRYSDNTAEHIIYSDQLIVLGNEFTRKTYIEDGADESIKSLSAFYYDTYDIDLEKKNFEKAKKHVLWYGSGGLLHKGLDLAIDTIKEMPELTLHICGASDRERGFFNYYSDALHNKIPNIINYGFVKMDKPEFRKIMDLCGCVLFPTLCEGGAAGLINVIANGGLIPITSKASSVDINDFGFVIEPLTICGVTKSINEYLELSTDDLKLRSKLAKQSIRENYSYDLYQETLQKYIKDAVTS